MRQLKHLAFLFVVFVLLTSLEENQKATAESQQPATKKTEEPWETPSGLLLHLTQQDKNQEQNEVAALLRVAFFLNHSGAKKQIVFTTLNQARKAAYKIKPVGYRISNLMYLASCFSNAGYKNEALAILKQAEQETTKIKGNSDLATVLIKLATHYHHHHKDDKKTLVFLKQAMEVTKKMKDEGLKQPILRKISQEFLQIGEVQQAIGIAQKMKKTSDKTDVLELIASSLASSGEIEQAIEIAQQIKQIGGKKKERWILDYIARIEVNKGNVESALKIAQMTQGKDVQSSSKRKVLVALTKAGKMKQAVKIAKKIEDVNEKNSTLFEIAFALVEKERRGKSYFRFTNSVLVTEKEKKLALGILKPLLTSLTKENETISHPYYLKKIASVLILGGEKKQAAGILKQALNKTKIKGERSSSEMALLLTQAGEVEQAVAITKEIKDACLRADTLHRIAKNLLKNENKKRAIPILKQSIEEAQKIKEWYHRDTVLGAVVSLLVDAGEIQDALKITQKMTPAHTSPLCRTISFSEGPLTTIAYDRASALRHIASSLTQSGDISQALKVIQKIKVPRDKEQALSRIASFLAEKEEIKQAIKVAQQMDDSTAKNYALYQIALAFANSGKFKQAIELASKAPPPHWGYNTPSCFMRIARVLVLEKKSSLKMDLAIPFTLQEIKKSFTLQEIKKSFTLQEKQIAKQLIQAVQAHRKSQNKKKS